MNSRSNYTTLLWTLIFLVSCLFPGCHSYKSTIDHEINDPNIRNQISDLEEQVKQNPKNKELYLRLAEVYLSTKNYRTSDHLISKALKIDRDYYDAFYMRARLYLSISADCSGEMTDRRFTIEDRLFYRLIYENYKVASKSDRFKKESVEQMRLLWPLADFSEANAWGNIKKVRFTNDCYKWVKPEIRSKNLACYITENSAFECK
jgi:tetratricopeptide (TPR) repeat protein